MAVDTRGLGLWFFVGVDSGFSSAVLELGLEDDGAFGQSDEDVRAFAVVEASRRRLIGRSVRGGAGRGCR